MTHTVHAKSVNVVDSALEYEGDRLKLYGGAVHYWRLDRETWPVILDEVVKLGFSMVSIYIPWEAHEISRGKFDFGQVDPRTDIDAFLTLCEERSLHIIVRPGPQINSEMTWFGYPKRILANESLHAKNSSGGRAILTQVPKPIPALSYAVDEFFDEVALWYDAICPILAKHSINNGGGIVAAQVDNEMAFFFGINAYSADFSDASLEKYRAFVLKKYGGQEGVAKAYSLAPHTAVEDLEPPRRFEGETKTDIPWYTDWSEYRETYLIDAMDRLAGMMRARGLDQIALFHNYPHPLGPGGAASGFTCPFNIAKLEEKLDFVGFDIYSRKHLYHHIKTVASYVVGTSRFPYIPEFIAGVWAWYLHPGDSTDEEFVTKAALMQGIKGFSRYMLVERDKWLYSPIRRDGTPRPMAAMHKTMNDILSGVDFRNLRRRCDTLLLANREYDRLEASSVLVSFPGDFLETPSGFSEYPNRMTVSDTTFGFEEAPQMMKTTYFNALNEALKASAIQYVLSDTDLAVDRWKRFKTVALVSAEWLDADTQRGLVDYAAGGGTVVLGPYMPGLGHTMEPCTIVSEATGVAPGKPASLTMRTVGQGKFIILPSLDEVEKVGEILEREAGIVPLRVSDNDADVVVHDDITDDRRKVVFVCNPTDHSVRTTVTIGEPIATATELWNKEPVTTESGSLVIDLAPYTIAICDCRLK